MTDHSPLDAVDVTEVRVLRLQPHDALLVRLDALPAHDSEDDLQDAVAELRDQIAAWARLDVDRVLLAIGVNVDVVRSVTGATIEVVRPDSTEPEEDDDATLSVRD